MMKKRQYEMPVAEICLIATADIIAVSGLVDYDETTENGND